VIDRYLSPEEIRRLVSALLVAVGGITIFALFAFIVVPGLRNANRPPAPQGVSPPQGETGWLDPTEYPPARGYELPAVDPQSVLTASPELLKTGKVIFEQNCAACHGTGGHGDGPASAGISPQPRDLTAPKDWKNGHQLVGIYKTLSEGIGESSMSSYTHLRPQDRMAVAHYVQSLGDFPHGPEDQDALEALAKQFASAGERVPNKIPVSMAMARLEEEFTSPAPLSLPAAGADDPGARLFAGAVLDRTRAAQTLALASGWRTSVQVLARTVVSGAPGNGFAASVATLNLDQWRAFQATLVKATSP
jgi:mono/diheme cytochrome c family protein